VMSVYNNADTLSAALDSILTQEGVVLEFIVIDDGSTDGSGRILDKVAQKDSRLKVIHQQNSGLTQALITGCRRAVAPWIARQDADDISLSGRLKSQLDCALQPSTPSLVTCGAICRTPEGLEMFSSVVSTDPEQLRSEILENGKSICAHGTAFFPKEAYDAVGGYRSEFYYAQDLDLFTRLAEKGGVMAVEACLYEYQFSPVSISGQHRGFQLEFYRLIREGYALRRQGKSDQSILEQAERLKKKGLQARRGKATLFNAYYFMGMSLLNAQPKQATSYFFKALRAHPWSIKTLVRLIQSILKKRKSR